MSMFSAESAKAIGLDRVLARWPHLTGRGVRILQVEWDLARTDHVEAVRAVMAEIAPDAEIRLMGEKEYYKHLAGAISFGFFSINTWSPRVAEWDIENHSYTGSRAVDDAKLAQAMDTRIARDGVLVYAASGNGLADVKPLWHRSKLAVMCGAPTSPAGNYLDGQAYPDVVVPTQWTSIASPVMAACAALARCATALSEWPMTFELNGGYPPIINGTPRIDYWIADILGNPRAVEESPAPPPVTWEEKRQMMSFANGAWAPVTVEQSRTVTEFWRVWEESSTGEIRNDRTEEVQKQETRTAKV